METLVIVRRIREAESLAASGQHDDASQLLEPLLTAGELTDTHRQLISKKIGLFKRQKERLTRIVSRRATALRVRESDESAERTAIRDAVGGGKETIVRGLKEDNSERPTGPAKEVPGSENTTESLPVPKSFKPGTRMLTPEMLRSSRRDTRQVETEIPRRSTETEIPGHPDNETEIPGQPTVRDSVITPLPARKDEDSHELTPISEDTGLSNQPDSRNGQDPRETDIFEARFESKNTRAIYGSYEGGGHVDPEVADDDVPTIGRASLGKPIASSNDTPAGWHDSPVVKVTDSIIMPQVPEPEQSYSPDSAFIEAADYANQADSGKSSPELKALASRLPDDDLRRELALEVVQLREQMAKIKRRKDRRDSTRNRIDREKKPESGQFHIPASQANTIVRRASGGKGIDVHMPTRDEDIEDLAVLHKDSVRSKKVKGAENDEGKRKRSPTDRIELASEFVNNEVQNRPNLWKPLGVYLGFVVIVAVICWGVYLGYRSMSDGSEVQIVVSGQEVAGHKLGQDISNLRDSPEWSVNTHTSTLMSSDGKFSLRYDSNNRLIALAVMIGDVESLDNMQVHFRAKSFELSEAGTIEDLLKAFGSVAPSPPFSDRIFSTHDEGTLSFIDDTASDSKPVVLEFHYVGRDARHPKWVQLRYEASADILPQFHKVEK